MKLLVTAHYLPMPDRQAAMLRFFRLLAIIAPIHEIHFFAYSVGEQRTQIGQSVLDGYEAALRDLGIEVSHSETHNEGWPMFHDILREHKFDAVLFEHYLCAEPHIEPVRLLQPHARVVIDSIDLNFTRLFSKAQVTRKRDDFDKALQERSKEMATYRKCDVVIAISDQDKSRLLREDRTLDVEVIPLIYPLHPLGEPAHGSSCNLIFVGNFDHSANVDAVLFFCREIFPIIKRAVPGAKLLVIGNSPTDAVVNCRGEDVDVIGFVPDLAAYYRASDIAIAPLTWGGGIKGKVAEAMANGLPVVATSVAIDGFGLTPGRNVVLGDTPQSFADGVIMLHQEPLRYHDIKTEARKFIEAGYSDQVIKERITQLLHRLERLRPKRMRPKRLPLPLLIKKTKRRLASTLDRYVLWRFR